MLTLLFIINFTTTAIMTGVIWTIQLVHYPFFHRIDKENYGAHMEVHRKTISYIVIPVMLLELGTAFGLVLMESPFRGAFGFALSLLILIWISTAVLQVPSHSKLASGYDRGATDKLVKSNWIRTGLWSMRLTLLLYILSQLSLFDL